MSRQPKPRTVILVPRRADGGHRDDLWAWCRAWWESRFPDLPIFEGHHDDGLFNRSAAVNLAARLAGNWDVALVIDADVIADPVTIRESIDLAHRWGDRMVMPFDRRHNLAQAGSARIRNGFTGSWSRYVVKTYRTMVSSIVAVPRPLWNRVGGFDEKFAGWGFEDTAFALACETLGGHSPHRLEGECWHLWHPAAPEGKRGTPSFQRNRARRELYSRALGNVYATLALLEGGTPDVPVVERPAERIPRILHRVVPKVTTPEVEQWWERFADIHPGWTMLTHRDPLKPKDWPLTSPSWKDVQTGAQLADLVRLEALLRWGGIYVDSDCEPYRSLEPLLGLHAFAAWEDRHAVPNAVMGAEPNHPAIREALDLAVSRVKAGTWQTGPGTTTEVFVGRDDVLLLPPGSFYPYHYKERHRRNVDHEGQQPWAFMAHHWAGSWVR